MKNFITKFGTHYAKEAVMGIGVDFETRYNQEETKTFTQGQRQKCNSENGGVGIFGFSVNANDTDCKGTMGNMTIGGNSSVKRWQVTTYGTLLTGTANLSDWAKLVAEMWKDKSLAPVPIRQNLNLIPEGCAD